MGRIPRLALIGTKLFREAIHAILRKNREELNINILEANIEFFSGLK